MLPVVHEVCGVRHHEDQREPVAADLHGGDCLGGDQQLLDRYGLQHGKIWLEMTELGKSADNGKLLETAHRLQDKKFNLVMDDFGKGESNFVRLMDFEFQSIKLDKELVWGIGNRKMGMPIVQTLLVFAQRNHIWVTAEGIETREQAKTAGKARLQLFYRAT